MQRASAGIRQVSQLRSSRNQGDVSDWNGARCYARQSNPSPTNISIVYRHRLAKRPRNAFDSLPGFGRQVSERHENFLVSHSAAKVSPAIRL